MCKVQVYLTTSMIPHYQNDKNNVQGTSKFYNINDTPLPKTTKTMCKVQVSFTISMIPHYQNDENNVQGTSIFNNINDTPLPKRQKQCARYK